MLVGSNCVVLSSVDVVEFCVLWY